MEQKVQYLQYITNGGLPFFFPCISLSIEADTCIYTYIYIHLFLIVQLFVYF